MLGLKSYKIQINTLKAGSVLIQIQLCSVLLLFHTRFWIIIANCLLNISKLFINFSDTRFNLNLVFLQNKTKITIRTQNYETGTII